MNFYQAVKEGNSNQENIIVTIIEGKDIGEKLLLSDGAVVTTTNENTHWDRIIQCIPQEKKSQVVRVDQERVYVEFIHPSYKAVICGAGHISMALIKMCKLLELPVTVIDDRLTFANNAKAAGADEVICEPFEAALTRRKSDRSTFYIIVTRGHRYDQTCLGIISQKENAYIGMIGSRVRVAKVLNHLKQEKGISEEILDRVYTPIGLKIGAETPIEIAIAIMAEIIEVKNKELGSSTFSKEVLNAILDRESSIPKALVTIVSRKGSAPREVGTKMVVTREGNMIGTIGGGCVESEIRQTALDCIDSQQCKLKRVDMTGADAEDDGMVCGGIVELFVEPIL